MHPLNKLKYNVWMFITFMSIEGSSYSFWTSRLSSIVLGFLIQISLVRPTLPSITWANYDMVHFTWMYYNFFETIRPKYGKTNQVKVELERSLLHLYIQYHRKIPNLFQIHHHAFTSHQVNGNTSANPITILPLYLIC